MAADAPTAPVIPVMGGARAARAWLWATVALTVGAFAVAVTSAPVGSASAGRGLGWIIFVGSSGHVASTGWLYSLRDVREYAASRRWRFCWLPGLLVLTCALTAATLPPGAVARLGRLFPVAVAAFGTAAVTGTVLLSRRPRAARPAGFCVMYLMAVWFSLPVFVFASPYAAVGGMTIAHGMQYLLLVGLIAAGSRRRGLGMAALCNVVLLGGAVLSVMSHLHSAGPGGRLLFGGYLGAVIAHFVVDAGLWRMRDSFPRAFMRRHLPYLLSSADRSPAGTR